MRYVMVSESMVWPLARFCNHDGDGPYRAPFTFPMLRVATRIDFIALPPVAWRCISQIGSSYLNRILAARMMRLALAITMEDFKKGRVRQF